MLNKADQDSQVNFDLFSILNRGLTVYFLVNNSYPKSIECFGRADTIMAVSCRDAAGSSIKKLYYMDWERLGISHG